MYKKKSTRKFLLVIAGLAVFLMACGLINQVMEQIGSADEVPVEEPVTPDEAPIEEPVIVDEPAVVDDPGDSELPADFALYPGAELFKVTYMGGQSWVHRYLTNDPVDQVQAFYQSQYPILLFEDADICIVAGVAQEDFLQSFEELIMGIGVGNLWICRTDEAYFNLVPFFEDIYIITAEDLEALPENMTLIEIWVGRGN